MDRRKLCRCVPRRGRKGCHHGATEIRQFVAGNGQLNLNASLDLQYDTGIQKTKIDIKQYADTSLVREAVARLK